MHSAEAFLILMLTAFWLYKMRVLQVSTSKQSAGDEDDAAAVVGAAKGRLVSASFSSVWHLHQLCDHRLRYIGKHSDLRPENAKRQYPLPQKILTICCTTHASFSITLYELSRTSTGPQVDNKATCRMQIVVCQLPVPPSHTSSACACFQRQDF